MSSPPSCTAFAGTRRLASGSGEEVAPVVAATLATDPAAQVLVFDDATGRQIDLDLGPVRPQPTAEPRRGPGRPRLGVVAREVTLLPRHWEWLNGQPGGASVALRRLVDEARKTRAAADRLRQARAAADRFMMALAGDRPGYEEAARALYAGDGARFARLTADWPADVRDHARSLAAPAFVTLP